MSPIPRLVVSIAAVLAAAGCSPSSSGRSANLTPASNGSPSSAALIAAPSARESVGAGQAATPLEATVVVRGIRGAGAIAQIQAWHRGSPLHDSPALNGSSQPGQILDPVRLLVASSSNFGAPLAIADQAPGSVLSVDLSANGGTVDPNFAADGSQASTLGGAVRLFSAQSPAYLNSIHTPGAATAGLPSASLPTGISNNNGHGRPWYSNAPAGASGDGTITVIDPHGEPLAGGPSAVAGGVFAGDLTNRNAATTHGLTSGAVGLAIMTKSPDGSGKAVFASPLADGSVVQIHVRDGVDELAPPGTIHPLPEVSVAAMESTDPHVVSRAGIAFNWAPNRILYVADPLGNQVVALDLTDDGHLFHSTARALRTPAFSIPVDVAPVVPETEADNFSSNTSLGAGSDLYVLNRGNNTIVRINQAGQVLAVRTIHANVPGFRANGIATSPTGAFIYVAAQTPDRGGVVLKMSGFGTNAMESSVLAEAAAAGAAGDIESLGSFIFSHPFSMDEGVGPLFNGQSCEACHSSPTVGGQGVDNSTHDFRVGRMVDGEFAALRSPVTRQHSITELGGSCGLTTGIPRNATVVSQRITPTLVGTALIDDVSDQAVLAAMNAEPAAVRGHPNYLSDGRIGRFGWKAHEATLVEFMGDAFRGEMGVTNNIRPRDLVEGCGANRVRPEVDSIPLVATAAFLNTIDPPVPSAACLSSAGAATFAQIGCSTCHTPSMPGPGRSVNLYSDLLLHDMGPGLADGVVQESASGNEFRTTPLWKLSARSVFLHNGSATTVTAAIAAHGGQAAASAAAFGSLSDTEKQALLDFLGCI